MPDVIENFKSVIIQIATPYSTGTGFLLPQFNIIVTNEHVVRDNNVVVIDGVGFNRCISRVIFLDAKHDIAFLEAPKIPMLTDVLIRTEPMPIVGEKVYAVGHPFGIRFTVTSGIISKNGHHNNGVLFLQHDAALNPGNSGGPLLDEQGYVIGINTFIIQNGQNIGFALPIKYVEEAAHKYAEHHGACAVACEVCSNLVFESVKKTKYCPYCGSGILLPSDIEPYEPIGMAATIEALITETGHNVIISRRGPNAWELVHGSAKITIYYYEKTGLITGEAYLCTLPNQHIRTVYEFLLQENYNLAGLTLSVKQQDIILSLLIYDRFFNVDTGLRLMEELFKKADHYDNILVEQYGAAWKQTNEEII